MPCTTFYRAQEKRKTAPVSEKGAVLEKARPTEKSLFSWEGMPIRDGRELFEKLRANKKECAELSLKAQNCNRKGAYFLGARCFETHCQKCICGRPFIGRAVLKRKRLILEDAQSYTEKRI